MDNSKDHVVLRCCVNDLIMKMCVCACVYDKSPKIPDLIICCCFVDLFSLGM